MGKDSDIQWTHHTFNPWWGCARVSPGCENCYAETFAHRLGFKVWGANGDRREFGDKHWAEPLKWNKAAQKAGERHRVFCASMADVFEDRDDLVVQRGRLWALIDQTRNLDWLLLTKRPENMIKLAPLAWRDGWPYNIWAGCTVEDQKRFDERYPHLLRVPCRTRFFSMEPLLGAVDITPALGPQSLRMDGFLDRGVNWVIIGGESGHGARVFDCAHARDITSQCERFGVPVFVKQMGAIAVDADYSLAPLNLRDHWHGGDISEFPEDLRVREFPR